LFVLSVALVSHLGTIVKVLQLTTTVCNIHSDDRHTVLPYVCMQVLR